MKTFALAAFCALAVAGFGVADEFPADIIKVEGNKVTYSKLVKALGERAKKYTAEVNDDAKILKAVLQNKSNTFERGESIEQGLKNDIFAKMDSEKGITVVITTDDKTGKIAEIWVIERTTNKAAKKKGVKKGIE